MNQKMIYFLMIKQQMIGSPSSSGESFWMQSNLAAALPKHAPPKPTRPRCPKVPNWEEVAAREPRCEIRRRSPDKDDLGRHHIGNIVSRTDFAGIYITYTDVGEILALRSFAKGTCMDVAQIDPHTLSLVLPIWSPEIRSLKHWPKSRMFHILHCRQEQIYDTEIFSDRTITLLTIRLCLYYFPPSLLIG